MTGMKSVRLDGVVGSYIDLLSSGLNTAFPRAKFTLMLSILVEATMGWGSFPSLLGARASSQNEHYITFATYGAKHGPEWVYTGNDNTGSICPVIPNVDWYHIAIFFDGTTGHFGYYFNRTLITEHEDWGMELMSGDFISMILGTNNVAIAPIKGRLADYLLVDVEATPEQLAIVAPYATTPLDLTDLDA
jgi:hypothetical protein